MKHQKHISFIIGIIILLFLSCNDENVVENIESQPTISIGQTSSDTVGIAITASNSEAANQTTNISFTKDTVLVSYSVTAYDGGEASITLSNAAMESRTFDLNSNTSIGQEPLNFKPTQVYIDIKTGFTGVVAMALIGK